MSEIYNDNDSLIEPKELLAKQQEALRDCLTPQYREHAVLAVGKEEAKKVIDKIQEMYDFYEFTYDFLDSVDIEEWRELPCNNR
jgi:hypothetical protein